MVTNLQTPHKMEFSIPPLRPSPPKEEHRNIVVISVYESEADLVSAINSGAAGYILNDSNELAAALMNMGRVKSNGISHDSRHWPSIDRREKRSNGSADNDLSKREEEVLKLVANGASNRKIAADLFISENTVKTHLRNIMNKLGVANRSQAAVYAVKVNLVCD